MMHFRVRIFLFMGLLFLVKVQSYSQNFPFPQNITYDFGFKPTVANTTDAINAYNFWKANFVTTTNAGGFRRVKYPQASNFTYTASEGVGYGMLLSAYAADKVIFDDIYNYYKLKVNPQGLMQWYNNVSGTSGTCSQAAGECNSATDGDEDIAFSLIVAHCQWGSMGTINYIQEAENLINNIMTWEVDLPSGRLRPGEFWGGPGCIDPSYFTVAYYPYFAAVTGDPNWDVVRNYCLNFVQNYSNATSGLFRDFSQENGAPPTGGDCSWRESNYAYDASRIPWRLGLDFLWHGEIKSRDACRKMVNWARTATPISGNATNFVDCLNWDGSGTCGPYKNNPIISCMGVGAMATDEAINVAWANAMYTENVARADDWFYNYTLRTINLFIQTGNMWEPNCVLGPLPLSANAGMDVSICNGNSTTLNGTGIGGTSPYTYSWSPTTGLSNPIIPNPIASPASTTTYTLTVTDDATPTAGTATDQVIVTVIMPQSLPVAEGFESATFPSDNWTLSGSNSFTRNTTCTAATGTGSMMAATFGNTVIGNTYELTTPYLNFPAATSTTLSFKYATRFYNVGGTINDRYDDLKVYISTGCGGAYTPIWTQAADGVTNTTATVANNASFCPGSVNDWDLETVDLSAYAGGVGGLGVRLKFVVTNGNGTNVYLDDISIVNSNAILPVSLLSFEGHFDSEEVVKLNWHVTNETNVKGYKILRSTNDISLNNWKEIGWIPALNWGNKVNKYTYYDKNLPVGNSLNYYKLVTAEFDGNNLESKIIAVSKLSDQPNIIVSPNPFDNSFKLEINGVLEKTFELLLLDVYGKVMGETVVEGRKIVAELGEHLPNGIYYLQIKSATNLTTIKLLKIK